MAELQQVSENDKQCCNCKHWDTKFHHDIEDNGYGLCGKIKANVRKKNGFYCLAQISAYYDDACLETRWNFGCVQFEAKLQ